MSQFILWICLATASALAQESATKTERPPPKVPPAQLQMRLGGAIWQENVRVRNDAGVGNMETQSQGIMASLAYHIPTGGRTWLQHYSADLGFGAIKGKGSSAAIPDELKGQPWLIGGVTPGLIYRTSPISAVGFMLPVYYRMIEWKLKSGTTFNPDDDSSFSVGVQGVYINQLTKNNYLNISFTHQVQWSANIWNLSWQYKFF